MNTLETSLISRSMVESFGTANTQRDMPICTREENFNFSTAMRETTHNTEVVSRDPTPIEDLILHRATLSTGKLIFKGRLVRE